MFVTFSDGTILIIEETALNKIYSYCQSPSSNESGGVLLGKKRTNCNEYIICDISTPSLRDKSGPCFFIRNKYESQKIINDFWEKTNGVVNYIGEWHTHNTISPVPSQIDHKLIKQVILDKSNSYEHIFMIILGSQKELYIGMANSRYGYKILEGKNVRR